MMLVSSRCGAVIYRTKQRRSYQNTNEGGCTMSLMSEFKEFAVKGNVVDMAVGIIVGGAFGKIVSSFVSDVIMPPIGLMLGGGQFR